MRLMRTLLSVALFAMLGAATGATSCYCNNTVLYSNCGLTVVLAEPALAAFRIEVQNDFHAARVWDCPDPLKCNSQFTFVDYAPHEVNVSATYGGVQLAYADSTTLVNRSCACVNRTLKVRLPKPVASNTITPRP